MCWGQTASITMVGVGVAAAGIAYVRKEPKAIWLTLGYFSVMEALQASGYWVVNACGTPANQTITLLSFLHIVFQPFFINAFAMELVPGPVRKKVRRAVFAVCAASAAVMLMQLVPIEWAGNCKPGSALCGDALCLKSGEWHIGWHIPYNGLLVPFENFIGLRAGFPTYMFAAFIVPLIYGAWRFVVFHALAGPFLASFLTSDMNEMPAIWCLFSIGIVLMGLSPFIRQKFRTESWWVWPKSWQH